MKVGVKKKFFSDVFDIERRKESLSGSCPAASLWQEEKSTKKTKKERRGSVAHGQIKLYASLKKVLWSVGSKLLKL